MLKVLAFLFTCAAFAADVSAQQLILILDRAPSSESVQSLGLTQQTDAFIADDFVVGAAKEDWVIGLRILGQNALEGACTTRFMGR